MFSKACEYSIKASIFLASRQEENRRARLPEIAAAINSPEAFTAKLLQILVKKKLLLSIKGPKGGFELAEGGDEITLYQVVEAIDGPSLFESCALGLKKCSEVNPCPVHQKFKTVRQHLAGILLTTTVKEAGGGVNIGKTFLKMKE